MDVRKNIPLKNYLTMKLGGPARFMTDAHKVEDVINICRNSKQQGVSVFILGGGSNVIATDKGFNGIVVRIRIPGFDIIEEDGGSATIKIGAGETWDEVVKKTVDMGLSGVEAMSGIPGTAGATPIQNVGAYGQEIADTLVVMEAYDRETDKIVTITPEQCRFSYRDSIFKNDWKGRFVITNITLKLSKNLPQPPFYAALQRALEEKSVAIFTPQIIRDTILSIRAAKLPDPKDLPNSGSFFKNSIVDKWRVEELKKTYPEMPAYEMTEGKYKVPSGWLIDTAGLKGAELFGMYINEGNALVLINKSANSYQDLAKARDKILRAVHDKFGILMEQEPLEIEG